MGLGAQVHATNQTWDNGASNFLWDTTSANWTGATFVSGTDAAIFGSTGSGTITVDAGGIATKGITINAGAIGYVFAGGAISNTGSNVNLIESVEFDNNFSTTTRTILASGKTATFTGGGSLQIVNSTGSGSAATYQFTAGAYALTGVIAETNSAPINLNFTGSSTFASTGANLANASTVNFNYDSSGASSITNITTLGNTTTSNGTLIQKQGTINSANSLVVGAKGSATLDIQGGVFTMTSGTSNFIRVSNDAAPVSGAVGTVSVSGGTLTAGTIALNSASGATSNLQVSNGTLNVDAITQSGAGSKSVSLSGGTIGTNTVTSATWTPNMSLAGNVIFRPATMAGASANITLSGVLSGSGGFTVNGLGSVTLSGVNTYTGTTTILAGNLATSGSGTLGSGNVIVAFNASLTTATASFGDTATLTFAKTSTANSIVLGFAGLDTIGNVYDSVSATYLAAGTYAASDLNNAFGTTVFSGSGTLVVTATAIPEPSQYVMLFGGLVLLATWSRRRVVFQA